MAKTIKGKTDLWTTAPEVASLLLNPEDGYGVSLQSHKKKDFVCQYCGTVIKDIAVRSVLRYGLQCPVCSDGLSYGEKFIANLLNQLNVDYVHDKTTSWSNSKRYDFIITDSKIIIEVHGKQHYEKGFNYDNARTLSEERKNDSYKKELALLNGIEHYVELDAKESSLDYLKQSVLKSEMSLLFDLSAIDWQSIADNCIKSKVQEVCDLWNSGIKSTFKIAEKLKMHVSTVSDYLKQCASAGLCDYTVDKHKKIICVDTGKVYDSLEAVGNDGFNMSQVSACCHGKANTSGGYNWCFYNEYDPTSYVMKAPNITNKPKKVLCIETSKVYQPLSCVKDDGFSIVCVSNVCRGVQEKHKGYHFKFID